MSECNIMPLHYLGVNKAEADEGYCDTHAQGTVMKCHSTHNTSKIWQQLIEVASIEVCYQIIPPLIDKQEKSISAVKLSNQKCK